MKPEDDDALSRLLASARKADLPDRERLARVKAQLLPAGGAAPPRPSSRYGAARALRLPLLLGGALVVLGSVTYVVLRPAEAPAPRTAPAPVSPPSAATPEPAAPAPAPPEPAAPSPGRPATGGAPAARPARAPKRASKSTLPASPEQPETKSTLAEETALLRMATLAAHAGRIQEAREQLARFAQLYPNSQLQSERERLLRYIAERERSVP